jgi:hypothetical protein
MLPDSKQGREMAFVFAVAQLRCQHEQKTREMLATLAPWMGIEERGTVVTRARKYTKAGRGIGKRTKLTEVERHECRVWWLASIDGDMARTMSRRIDGRQGRKERREKEGSMTRDEYLASHAGSIKQRAKAAGVPESTYRRWMRQGKVPGGAGAQSGAGSPTSYKTTTHVCRRTRAIEQRVGASAGHSPSGPDADPIGNHINAGTVARPPRQPPIAHVMEAQHPGSGAKLPWWRPRCPEVRLYDSGELGAAA